MRVEVSPEISTRDEFGWLCTKRELNGVAVEVGTCRGDSADTFLGSWPEGLVLICIDNYGPYGADPYTREPDKLAAAALLSKHGFRCRSIWEADSPELADRICAFPGMPDFVYLDGDHTYEGCKLDIEIWWPRLTENGILAGHDYSPKLPGVIHAVNEFAGDATVYLTHEAESRFPSWYVYKRQQEFLFDRWRSSVL